MMPGIGGVGVGGWGLNVMPCDGGEEHPSELVTVKVYVPG